MARSAAPTEYATDCWYMEYVEGTSSKFYEVMIVESGVCVLRWGRIGSAGQSSVTAYPTYDEARDQGLKQVFAKKSKGYVTKYEATFMASTNSISRARNVSPVDMHHEFITSMRDGAFNAAKSTVLKHYAEFAEQVKTLMDRAATGDFAQTMEEYEQVEKVWAEINDKHAEVSAAMSIAKATLMQKLMSGAL